VHNIEMRPGQGGILVRSAGTGAVLQAREANWAQLALPSGEIRRVPSNCKATIGKVGHSEHGSVVLGKAGRSRWLGRRPHVRGTAMNPIDHPHGGGVVSEPRRPTLQSYDGVSHDVTVNYELNNIR